MEDLKRFAKKEVDKIISHLMKDDREILEAYIANRESEARELGSRRAKRTEITQWVSIITLGVVLIILGVGWFISLDHKSALEINYASKVANIEQRYNALAIELSREKELIEERCIERILCSCENILEE